LEKLKEHLNETQQRKFFVKKITIHAWRLSVRSAMALIKEQLNAAFAYALTGKWNQDPLEVGLEFI
jgi:hypothetical protein